MTLILWTLVSSLLYAAGIQSASTPEEISALVARAGSALVRGDLESAQRDFQHAATLDGNNPAPVLGLCEIHGRRGELFEALELCRKAQRLAPSDALVSLEVGRLLARIGAVSEALDALDQAIRIDPDAPTPYILSALLDSDFVGPLDFDLLAMFPPSIRSTRTLVQTSIALAVLTDPVGTTVTRASTKRR